MTQLITLWTLQPELFSERNNRALSITRHVLKEGHSDSGLLSLKMSLRVVEEGSEGEGWLPWSGWGGVVFFFALLFKILLTYS